MKFTHYINHFLLFSDGACAHFKNNASMLNLVHHKTDFDLDACWTFTAAGHGKGAGDGIGAVLKSTTRRDIVSKNILLSARRSNKDIPFVHVFFLESDEVEEVKNSYLQTRSEKLRASGVKDFLFYSLMSAFI